MERKAVDVSAIIVSLNSQRFLRDCLDTLIHAPWRHITYEIIVADNGSTDDTLQMLAESYPAARVPAIGKNIGFCPAGNLAAREVAGRYLLFLNDDILIQEDAIAKLVEWMDAHPEAGMIGSRLLNIDGTDQFSSGRTFPGPMNALFGRKSLLTRLFPNARWARRYLLSDPVEETEPYLVEGGRVLVSSPNRLCPIDFFHGRTKDQPLPRLNPPGSRFLLSSADYRGLFQQAGCHEFRLLRVSGYWGFVNRGTHWRGRMLAFPVKCVFRLVSFEPLSILRALPISPWLVMLMRKEVAC